MVSTSELIEEHTPLYKEYFSEIDTPNPSMPTHVPHLSGKCNNTHGLSRPLYNKGQIFRCKVISNLLIKLF